MENIDISEALIRRKGKVCTSKDFVELFHGEYLKYISRMTNSKWILPLKAFRGIYYVLEANERERGSLKTDGFCILIRALNAVFGDGWYFGRMTALHLLGVIHQPPSVSYVMNGRYTKSANSDIMGKLDFTKISASMDSAYGIEEKEYRGTPYRVSTIERTAADYLYLYVHGHIGREQLVRNCSVFSPDAKRMDEIMVGAYPENSSKKMLTAERLIE